MEEEQKTHKQIERKKTLLIESLSRELDAKKKLEEDYYQSNNSLKVWQHLPTTPTYSSTRILLGGLIFGLD